MLGTDTIGFGARLRVRRFTRTSGRVGRIVCLALVRMRRSARSPGVGVLVPARQAARAACPTTSMKPSTSCPQIRSDSARHAPFQFCDAGGAAVAPRRCRACKPREAVDCAIVSFVVAPDAYDRFMGRYSIPLASVFADFAGVAVGQRILDVECGPGPLTAVLVDRVGAESVTAVDPSEPFVAAVRARHLGVRAQCASAESLPFGDGEFDAALVC